MSLVLVLGGVRSGKSELAEEMARSTGAPVVYIATSGAADPEMAERVAAHRGRRPPEWRTVETADPLPVLSEAGGATVLLDGVGGWIAALMESEGMWTDEAVAALGERGEAARRRAMARVRAFAGAAGSRPAATIAVAEEAGMGLVPSGPNGAGARRYL
ncbi:MAG: bifunctional adenosylcobinamide kinase/adenosylcobinamide-phosphate guanylyltransferase, partial [bacterium]